MEPDRWLGVELRHLAALQAVAEEGSFGRAAIRLGYTQSAVSQQIATLERLVGERLVERPGGPRPISITEAGTVLLRHADELNLFRMSARRPGFAQELGALLAELQQHQFGPQKLRALADARTCLVHADFKPSQLLAENERIGIVDFDRACLGDPALDVGRFMAQCHKEAVIVARPELRGVAESFREEYAARAGTIDRGLAHSRVGLDCVVVRAHELVKVGDAQLDLREPMRH